MSTSWKQHFSSLAVNDQGNQNLNEFSGAFSSELSSEEKLRNLVEDMDSMFFAADGEKKVQSYHSLKNLGGTRLRKENKVIALLGVGPVAVCVELSLESALKDCNLKTPKPEDLLKCASKEELAATRVTTRAVNFKGSALFFPPPFLRDAILNADTTEPLELILISVAAAKEFDRIHEEDEDYNESAMSHIEEFAQWAWGVQNEKVLTTSFMLRPEDGELQIYTSNRHQECIIMSLNAMTSVSSAPGENTAVLKQLAESISLQTEETARTNRLAREDIERAREREDNKKDKLKKLHPSILNMLQMAASTDGDRSAKELPSTCISFFNKETAALADQELSLQFQNMGMPDVGFAHGVVQALYGGNFTYHSACSPNNFSAFCFYEQDPLSNEQSNRHIILHLVARDGQGKTLDEIKASTRQVVKAPTNFNDLDQQLKYFTGLSQVFFGKDSAGTAGLRDLVRKVSHYRPTLKAKCAMDKSFATQVVYAVDTKMQRWLGECKIARDRSEVNDDIVDFNIIVNDILDNRFSVPLPLAFKKTDIVETNTSVFETQKIGNPNGKRKGKRDDDNDREKRVLNSEQVEEFKMKPDDDWRKFCGNSAQYRVDWNDDGCKMCPRWHSKGFCFKDCNHKASHVPKGNVSQEKVKEYKGYLVKVRKS